jgi:hypothetical protein
MKTLKLALIPLFAMLAACEPDIETVVVSQLTDPPLGGIAEDDRIEIYEGTAIGIQLQAFTEEPEDPSYVCCGADCDRQCRKFENAIDAEEVTVGGEGSVTVFETEDADVFIVIGERAGDGIVVVTAEDTDGFYEIPVRVVEQPAPEE